MNKPDIKRKIRRLLGKCHIGLQHSQEINNLLDEISTLNGNDIDLKPLPSKQMTRQTFAVHLGTDASGDLVRFHVQTSGNLLQFCL